MEISLPNGARVSLETQMWIRKRCVAFCLRWAIFEAPDRAGSEGLSGVETRRHAASPSWRAVH